MFDGRWRATVDRNTGPMGHWLKRHGITADVLTAGGLVMSVATAVAIGSGHLLLAVPLLAITGFLDLLDGPVAKASGTSSVRGAFFDSVADRVSDAIVMAGVSWYLISRNEGHLALLPLAVLGVTSLVSYERAKAEALGLSAKGGLMERAERMILLGVGFLASWLLVPVLWVLLVLTTLTAAGRFVRVWKVAEGPPSRAERIAAAPPPDSARWREGRVHSRWRARREGLTAPRSRARGGEPHGRLRARRQETPASRSGRVRRSRSERQALRPEGQRSSLRSGTPRRPGSRGA
jgi:CDP-diacylglycerol--glycerol-3-phosphate 3-phosphatidyltransferase